MPDNKPATTKPISTETPQKPVIPRPAPLGNPYTHSLDTDGMSTPEAPANKMGRK